MVDRVLRVVDFGSAPPLRSQTLWHALARGVGAGGPPTLSFVRPSRPYVCVGYHRRLDELDLAACERRKLPVYRRMVGGGPVYLDADQLFFQVCLPAHQVPAHRQRALRLLLEPAVSAFRAVGVDAELDAHGEIVVGDRKVCGHGAAEIEGAVVVVGNLIERFDHRAATDVLRTPSPEARRLLLRLTRRYLAATPCDPGLFQQAAVAAYAEALGLEARPGCLADVEHDAVAELDRRFEDRSFREGPTRPPPAAWQVKVRAGVCTFEARQGPSRVLGALVGDRLRHVQLFDAALDGSARGVARRIEGRPLVQAPALLGPLGAPGLRLARALAGVERSAL